MTKAQQGDKPITDVSETRTSDSDNTSESSQAASQPNEPWWTGAHYRSNESFGVFLP
jgi:hypothetical protein